MRGWTQTVRQGLDDLKNKSIFPPGAPFEIAFQGDRVILKKPGDLSNLDLLPPDDLVKDFLLPPAVNQGIRSDAMHPPSAHRI